MSINLLPTKQTSVRIPQAKTLTGAFRLFCTGTSPKLLIIQFLIALTIRLLFGEYTQYDLFLCMGIICYWPFQEWFLHLTVLHAKPRTLAGIPIDTPMARIHRYHHRHPWILETIFVPGRALLLLIPIHAGLWFLITPTTGLALTGITTFTLCSISYEWFHLFAHIPYQPKTRWMKSIQKNHRAHHFKNEHYWHAFVIPHIDKIFGTGPDPKTTPRSPTCKTLGVEDSFPAPSAQENG